jgi:hypothetical protein
MKKIRRLLPNRLASPSLMEEFENKSNNQQSTAVVNQPTVCQTVAISIAENHQKLVFQLRKHTFVSVAPAHCPPPHA